MSKLNNAKLALKNALNTFKEFPAQNKVGLGLGVTSLGVSLANFKRNNAAVELNEQRTELDQQSLSALQKIHKALVAKPKSLV